MPTENKNCNAWIPIVRIDGRNNNNNNKRKKKNQTRERKKNTFKMKKMNGNETIKRASPYKEARNPKKVMVFWFFFNNIIDIRTKLWQLQSTTKPFHVAFFVLFLRSENGHLTWIVITSLYFKLEIFILFSLQCAMMTMIDDGQWLMWINNYKKMTRRNCLFAIISASVAFALSSQYCSLHLCVGHLI